MGIILAAGKSTRFGSPKQLYRLGGQTLVERAVEAALASRLDQVVLVLGHKAREICKVLGTKVSHQRLMVRFNSRFSEGMSSSLRAGLAPVAKCFSAAMFLLADQPLIQHVLIDLVLDGYRGSEKAICLPVYGDLRGHPVIFNARFFDEILALEGDVGARTLLQRYPSLVEPIPICDPHLFLDIDTPKDLMRPALGRLL